MTKVGEAEETKKAYDEGAASHRQLVAAAVIAAVAVVAVGVVGLMTLLLMMLVLLPWWVKEGRTGQEAI